MSPHTRRTGSVSDPDPSDAGPAHVRRRLTSGLPGGVPGSALHLDARPCAAARR
ncbi:hypothetical protein [Rugosimonospora africana]|uniref:hypothetical protein n=1 Tax=Rugosimonospora africana TaxID=556532 RepID=UPI0019412238|nr:hypothetical protein [Rugosimonospora africana]